MMYHGKYAAQKFISSINIYNCIIRRSNRFPYIKIEKMPEKVDRLFPAFHLTKKEKETFPHPFSISKIPSYSHLPES